MKKKLKEFTETNEQAKKVKEFFKDPKKRKKFIIGSVIVVVVYLAISFFGINSTMNKIYSDLKIEKFRKHPVSLKKKDSFSILLLGVDTGAIGRKGGGRADAIVIVTVNPKEKKTTLVSVPRDTYTKIAKKNRTTKINEAYSYGGAATVINTVQRLFDIPIDYYIEVNMQGIEDIVNAVGGVTVKSPLKFSNYGYNFRKGRNSLDGREALAYATMRYDDPTGDYGRQGRQRQIIDKLISKIISYRVITGQGKILASMEKNVRTSFTFDEIITVQSKYNGALRNTEQIQLQGQGQMIGGVSYQIVPKKEIKRISGILKEQLNLKGWYK